MAAPPGRFSPPRTLADAIREITSFWRGALPLGPGAPARIAHLEGAFERRFPEPLREYLSRLAPALEHVTFRRVGNPVDLWPVRDLTPEPLGYRVDTSGNTLSDWSRAWFLFADVGADPIVVDLDRATDACCPVLEAMHGTGEWDFGVVADSIPQYLLLSAAVHHALALVADPIVDEPGRFELAADAADWLFPRVRGWAGEHYDAWVGVFTNR